MSNDATGTPPIPLIWSEPVSLERFVQGDVFRADAYKGSGVYTWIIKPPGRPDDERLVYVGRATSATTLTRRLRQHYLGQISGSYTIPAEFRDSAGQWNIDWDCPEVTKTLACEDAFTQVVRQGFAVARASMISVAAVREDLVRDVERQLLWDLQPIDTTWGTRSAPHVRLRFQHVGAVWATDAIKRQVLRSNKEDRSITDLGFEQGIGSTTATRQE